MKLREAIGWSVLVLVLVAAQGVDCNINGHQWSFHPVRKDGCSIAPGSSDAQGEK